MGSCVGRLRDWLVADFAYRMVVGVVGLTLLAVGLIAIPYPGPGRPPSLRRQQWGGSLDSRWQCKALGWRSPWP
ncbi:Conserved protein of unknown function (fragment) [Mycobacterium canettii CIPT 140060008]|uniref:PGPGW domain-containing protein n=1 Tax=Mycobacterium canetti TaxID=78331 RepID=A0ABV1MIK7_9MYCO